MSSADVTIRPLDAADSRLSYPLVRMTIPEIDFAEWCDILARSGSSETTPIMLGVFARSGCLIGLLSLTDGDITPFATSFMLAHQHDAVIGLARAAASTFHAH
jgi:hypothetical protein